ncbi:MAG: ABC transporter ATP-binding protein [Candidatus Odinarchaeota archaeon]
MEIKVDNVVFRYNSKPVLDGVTFEAKKCRITGIIGPNGSGKTTLLRCIVNILKPENGAIFIGNRAIHSYKTKELAKKLSAVPQISRLETGFTVFETVLLGRYPHLGTFQRESEQDFQVVKSVLERVGISRLANRDVNALSGGEKQLVAIALALAQEPRVLLLDEPTLHLDINMQYTIMELCREISRDKELVVIVVLHDLELAAHYCDDLIILKHGQIRAAGTSDEVIVKEHILDTYGVDVVVGRDDETGLKYILPHGGNRASSDARK